LDYGGSVLIEGGKCRYTYHFLATWYDAVILGLVAHTEKGTKFWEYIDDIPVPVTAARIWEIIGSAMKRLPPKPSHNVEMRMEKLIAHNKTKRIGLS